NQSAEAAYTFTDLAPLSGKSFYRLNMINRDGRRSYSPVVSVRFGEATATSIIPVPATNQIVLRTTPSLNGTAASIIDLQGKTVLRFTLSSTQQLDITSLASGTYYLKLADGSTHKFIKQ
ncbi:MAG: T9SS type A sorting domain-containing protein, partial [Sphingobacteriales bacterium]